MKGFFHKQLNLLLSFDGIWNETINNFCKKLNDFPISKIQVITKIFNSAVSSGTTKIAN